jgi:sulfur carrier protein ThiS
MPFPQSQGRGTIREEAFVFSTDRNFLEEEIVVPVTVKVHSILREVVGSPTVVVGVPDNGSVKDVLDEFLGKFRKQLHQKYEFEAGEPDFLKYFILSLNGTPLSKSGTAATRVKKGDVVDILEPIAGG